MTTWEPAELAGLTLGVLGGTGDQGRGLGARFAAAGLSVILGSREASRAEAAAATLPGPVRGADNASCAREASVVVVAVPWDGHATLLRGLPEKLAGKTVIDCVNPLGFDKQGAFALDVAEGSACEQAAALLPASTVVGAFHHLSAVQLLDPALETIDGDVMVVGDDRAATDLVQALAGLIPGMRGVYAGRLRNARQVEALTANLISVNRRYKAHAGIRIVGLK
jgi:8-hydroxy-5-deazaflavin:NADPH oxidoreductase